MHARMALVLAFFLAVLVGCGASVEIEAIDNPDAVETSDEGVATGPDGEAAALSTEAVYQKIENSVVFVLAPDELSSGSGIVIEGGWILTNAHVVDRHQSVLIGRSDGESLGLHPVHAVDWIFDLALIGPITDTSLVPIDRGISAELALGSRVMLAGFPDEDSAAPTPTITEGILSRRRFVALGDYPFLQVDATIAPGQSGGALVNSRGQLVGISGLEFGEGEFALVFAADPMWPRVDEMIVSGSSLLPTGPPVFELFGQVGPLRNYGFLIDVPESGSVDLLVTSDADVWVDLQTLGGITVSSVVESADPFRESGTDGQLYFDELVEGGEDVIATIEPGTYQMVIGSFGDSVTDVSISSANELRIFVDDEESRVLPTGQVVEGDFDWTRDTDGWQLPLEAGQQVVITADGISDTLIVLRFDEVAVASSDDEGLGLFGTGSRLTFTAEEAGTYVVEIGTYDQTRWGYLIEANVSDR